MLDIAIGAIVVVLGLALGVGVQLVFACIEARLEKLHSEAEAVKAAGDRRAYDKLTLRLVVSMVAAFAFAFVAVAAASFGWGAVSLLLVGSLTPGTASVIAGLVLFRLMMRAGRELQ